MPEVTLQSVDGGFDILVGGEFAGGISMHGNRLMSISIEEQYRDQGYGKQTITQLIDTLQSEHDVLTTSAVISPALESILERNGFERTPVDPYRWERQLD